ncbi:DUF559 domain-containing protein [Wenyingzhuangia sp. IMCC45574]
MNIEGIIQKLKEKIKENHLKRSAELLHSYSGHFDDFLKNESKSPLEKAFFLFLNQFPAENKDYIVYASENVLIPNIYDKKTPAIEYEIDFALYGGSINNPVKVAIECDGIRSHGHKNIKRDRRKEVNLQADGWIVMRFTSKEIHEELSNFDTIEDYKCDFLESIENTIKKKLKIIDYESYTEFSFRSKLTGYKWGYVTCPNCDFTQHDILNHKKITCRKCGDKYTREINTDENIKTEINGLLLF